MIFISFLDNFLIVLFNLYNSLIDFLLSVSEFVNGYYDVVKQYAIEKQPVLVFGSIISIIVIVFALLYDDIVKQYAIEKQPVLVFGSIISVIVIIFALLYYAYTIKNKTDNNTLHHNSF